MSDPAEDYGIRSRTSNVIPFPLSDATTSSETKLETLMLDVFNNPQIEDHLKSIMEAAVLNAWVKTRLSNSELRDDPFDAIYISELRADKINPHDIDQIFLHSDINDLSDKIQFDDGLDD